MSHLDYCNAILCDLPNTDISRLQAIQNMCAKLVKGATKYTSNEEVLYQLPLVTNSTKNKIQNSDTGAQVYQLSSSNISTEPIDITPWCQTRSSITIYGKKTGCPKGTKIHICSKIL